MIREQKKSDLPSTRIALRSSDRAEFGTISIAHAEPEVDYPRAPVRAQKKDYSKIAKVLRFSGNAALATAFIFWFGIAGKSDLYPGYPTRDLLLYTLLYACVAVLGLILHRLKKIFMEEI